MRISVLFFLFAFICFGQFGYGQTIQEFYQTVNQSKTAELARFFGDEIELCIKDDQQINTQEEAIKRMSAFLQTHKVKSIAPLHEGTSKDKKANYKVAKMITDKEVFRLFVFAESNSSKLVIKEIRIDKF